MIPIYLVSGREYWMINTGLDSQPGMNGGLLPRPRPASRPMASPNAFIITVDVDNLDESMGRWVDGEGAGRRGSAVCAEDGDTGGWVVGLF